MRNTSNIVRHVNYFRGKPGHLFALVFENEVRDVKGTEPGWYTLTDRPDFVGLVTKAPATGWGGMVPGVEDTTCYVPDAGPKEAAVEAVRTTSAEVRAEVAREAGDPAYALEKALKNHDWYAHYSDDAGVAAASDRHWDKIRGLMTKLPADKAEALVEKYRPKA